jgi:ParB family chromosome partitioning protein
MYTETAVDSGYKTLPLAMLEESSTNPRRTFDPTKLVELAHTLSTHGLIQPITVRPKGERFEIVAGARRYRAAQIAELVEVPVRVLELTDQQTLELQIVENSQRQDVHPYEEAAGYQRLLDLPGYSVETLVQKTGRSQSHIYARLTLLELIPEVATAFQEERITASHANLIARLPATRQAEAFEECWRKDYRDTEAHLLPAKNVAAWIQANLYLPLAAAPFNREDPSLYPTAGACTACPRRSGHNTALFCDVQGDQCLDASCYQTKVNNHVDREIAARPNLVQIEEGYRKPTEHRADAVRRGHFRELETRIDNPDAEPVSTCEAERPALIIYGQHIGTFLTVCTANDCPVHDPRQAKDRAERPVPVMARPTENETEEQTAARKADYELRQNAFRVEQERLQAVRQEEEERRGKEYEAEQERKAKQKKKRAATFQRILQNAPPVFEAPQLRALLRALINMDPYSFADDLAVEFNGDDENDQRCAEEVLLTVIDGLDDTKLTGFAVHLALAGHRNIPKEGEADFLAEAAAVFLPKEKPASAKKAPKPTKAPAKAAKTLTTTKPKTKRKA